MKPTTSWVKVRSLLRSSLLQSATVRYMVVLLIHVIILNRIDFFYHVTPKKIIFFKDFEKFWKIIIIILLETIRSVGFTTALWYTHTCCLQQLGEGRESWRSVNKCCGGSETIKVHPWAACTPARSSIRLDCCCCWTNDFFCSPKPLQSLTSLEGYGPIEREWVSF